MCLESTGDTIYAVCSVVSGVETAVAAAAMPVVVVVHTKNVTKLVLRMDWG